MQILYDGNCPICRRKVQFFRRHDRREKLCFVDIRSVDFSPSETGIPMHELEQQIHAILPDGTVISRMEVIRAAYREIGLGWIAAPTRWPLLRFFFDALYAGTAKHRHLVSRFFRLD